jgi:hypothetical protein
MPTSGPTSTARVHHEFIAAGLKRGLTAQRIWQDLVEERAYTGGYLTVQRYVRRIHDQTQLHSGHVWKLLRRLGWSWQKPARQAIERDHEEVQPWVREEWPRTKNPPAGSGPESFSRMRGAPR